MSKIEDYRSILKEMDSWDDYLMGQSGLPGPRANLELIEAVVEEGNEELFNRYLSRDSEEISTESPEVFLIICGVVGLGKLISQGKKEYLNKLRLFSSDNRWRVREGVAIALQRYGEEDMEALLDEMEKWSHGNLFEKRAVTAALCEPKLIKEAAYAKHVLEIIDRITSDLMNEVNRKEESFKILRKALGYGWSVAAVHDMEYGRPLMEKWFACEDKDIRWIMKENLKKNRLLKKEPVWTEYWELKLNE